VFDTLVFVSRDAIAARNRRVGPSRQLVFLKSAVELKRRLAEQSGAMVVLDPSGARSDALADVARAVAELRIPLLVWTDRTVSDAARVLVVARSQPVELLFHGVDDGPGLTAALRRAESISAPAALLNDLAERISRLPETIQLPTVALFSGVALLPSATTFVGQTCLSGSTVERRLREVGLYGVKRLIDMVRMARAPRQHFAACPVHDDHEIHETAGHREVRDVSGPDVVGPRDRERPQQVGKHGVRTVSRRRRRSLIDGAHAHAAHERADVLAANAHALVGSLNSVTVFL